MYLQLPGFLSELFFKDFVNILSKFLKTGKYTINWENSLILLLAEYFLLLQLSKHRTAGAPEIVVYQVYVVVQRPQIAAIWDFLS